MAWVTMRDLTAGDVVLESDWTAFKANLDNLEWIWNKPLRLSVSESLTVTSATGTTWTADTIEYLKAIPADLADGAAVYFETCLVQQNGTPTAHIRLTIDGAAVTGSELSSSSASPTILRTGNLASQLTGTTEATFRVEMKQSTSSGNSSQSYRSYLIVESL